MAFEKRGENSIVSEKARATNIRLDVIERQQNDVDFDQHPDAA